MTRKVEFLLVSFLRQGITGKASKNTEVSPDPITGTALNVTLFGKGIASYYPATGKLFLTDAGWQTATTKGRLNALLAAFAPGYAIYQRDHVWYLRTPGGNEGPWPGTAKFVRTNDPAQPVHQVVAA